MASSILNSDDGVISGTSGLKSTGGDDGNLVFQSKGTETARINTDKQIVAAAGTASLPIYSTTGDLNTGIFFPAADTIAFAEGGAEAMRIDSGGNLGLGVTPSAWGQYKAIQLANGVSFASFTGSAAPIAYITSNAFYDGSNEKYVVSQPAASYQLNQGIHSWFTASSGTAGNNITFTESMRIDSTGNLLVGTSTLAGKLTLYDGSSDTRIYIQSSTTGTSNSNGMMLGSIAGIGYVFNYENEPVIFGTNATERARITSGGDFLIGTSTKLSGGIDGLDINTAADTGITFAQSGTNKAYFYLSGGGTGTGWQWQTVSGIVVNVVSSTNGVTLANGGTSWGSLSDERKKDIIEPIENAATKVSSLRAVIGKYKTEEDGIRRAMLIAQDVQAVLPEAVVENSEGDLVLQYTETIPLLVAAIQELKAINDAQTQRIETLEAKVSALEANNGA